MLRLTPIIRALLSTLASQAVFFGLLNDLFPSIDPPRLVNDSLNSCVREVCEDMNLWPDDAFILKVSVAFLYPLKQNPRKYRNLFNSSIGFFNSTY